MEGQNENGLSLKAAVDREKNKVIYIESDSHFVDVLFSFLTIPIGSVISVARDKSLPFAVGCIKNVYESVENLGIQYFRLHSETGKLMLLRPRNGAESYSKDLKLKIYNFTEPNKFFLCSHYECTQESHKLLSPYKDVLCLCLRPMIRELQLSTQSSGVKVPEGVFVSDNTKFLITDDLQVSPLSTSVILSLLSRHGITDQSKIEEKTLNVGEDEVVKLLISSLVSKSLFTEVLLNHDSIPSSSSSMNFIAPPKEETPLGEHIAMKLVISKSANRVCYAEANSEFVGLVFSFLAVPLGYTAQKISGTGGSINNLCYSAVQCLDEKQFKSSHHKEILVNPRFAFGFRDANDLLGLGINVFHPTYYCGRNVVGTQILTTESGQISSGLNSINYNFVDYKGIVAGSTTMFMVTDSLVITPLSASSCLTLLKDLNVPFSDVEEKVVHVRKNEAVRLLLSSFISECALSSAFLWEQGNVE